MQFGEKVAESWAMRLQRARKLLGFEKEVLGNQKGDSGEVWSKKEGGIHSSLYIFFSVRTPRSSYRAESPRNSILSWSQRQRGHQIAMPSSTAAYCNIVMWGMLSGKGSEELINIWTSLLLVSASSRPNKDSDDWFLHHRTPIAYFNTDVKLIITTRALVGGRPYIDFLAAYYNNIQITMMCIY